MAQSILVIAESGAGKSTSIANLDPKETFIVNVANKPLPFKGWKNKYKIWSREDQTLRSYNLEGPPTIWKLFFKNRPIFGYFQFCVFTIQSQITSRMDQINQVDHEKV